MNETGSVRQSESWLSRNGWLLAATWLVFLVFPWLAMVTDDELGSVRKVAATVLVVAFALAYVNGFRRLYVVEREHTGRTDLALLIGLGVALVAVVGPAGLGVTPFVVAFTIFHFGWAAGWLALLAGVALTALVPLATDTFGELWFLAPIVGAVGLAATVIRSGEANRARQAELRTQLAVSDERNRLARDVHDVLGHSLTAIIVKAELCEKLLDGVDAGDDQDQARLVTCRQQLGELRSVGRSALAEIRATIGGLRAANLADEVTVARTVLADAGVELLVTGHVSDVPEQHRPLLAWVVREAVTNVVRHAEASRCRIELAPEPAGERIVLRISDDGVGIVAGLTDGSGGNGLRGVRERIEAAGGALRLRSDGGTTVEVVV